MYCKTCYNLRQKGNFCPLCLQCYQDSDFTTKVRGYGREGVEFFSRFDACDFVFCVCTKTSWFVPSPSRWCSAGDVSSGFTPLAKTCQVRVCIAYSNILSE